jgi:hypothetical protein
MGALKKQVSTRGTSAPREAAEVSSLATRVSEDAVLTRRKRN